MFLLRISSLSSTAHIVLRHLGRPAPDGAANFDATRLDDEAEDLIELYNESVPEAHHLDSEALAFGLKQEELSRPKDLQDAENFFESAPLEDKARLRSQHDYVSYAWLLAPPSKEAGTYIPHAEFGVAILYWLGDLRRWGGHCAKCNELLDALGTHATGSCLHGRHGKRHKAIIRVICAFLTSHGVPSDTETPHLFGTADLRRPADIALESLLSHQICAIDVTVVTAPCPTYCDEAALVDGSAALLKQRDKYELYGELCRVHDLDFIPIAIESYGRIAPGGMYALKQIIALCLSNNHEADSSAHQVQLRFLKQRISVCLVRENADMILYCAGRRFINPNDLVDPHAPEETLHDTMSLVPDIRNL